MCKSDQVLVGLLDKLALAERKVEYLQYCVDLMEDRLTELERCITGECEVAADFELE